jgi:ankyrin repeat protein
MQQVLAQDIVDKIQDGVECNEIAASFENCYSTVIPHSLKPYKGLLLSWAVYYKHSELVQMLLRREDAGEVLEFSRDPCALHIAIVGNDTDMVCVLLNAGADVHMFSKVYVSRVNSKAILDVWNFGEVGECKKLTAFEVAMISDNWPMIQLIRDRFIVSKIPSKQTLLHMASYYGAKTCLQELLSTATDDEVNAVDSEGKIPLVLCYKHPIEMLELLLPRSSTVASTATEGANPLHLLLSRESYGRLGLYPADILAKVEKLLAAGCSASEKTTYTKFTALHYVVAQVNSMRDLRFFVGITLPPAYEERVLSLVSRLLPLVANDDGSQGAMTSVSVLILHIEQAITSAPDMCHMAPDLRMNYVQRVSQAVDIGRQVLELYLQADRLLISGHVITNLIDTSIRVVIQLAASMEVGYQWQELHNAIQELFVLLLCYKILTPDRRELVMLLQGPYEDFIHNVISALGTRYAYELYSTYQTLCPVYSVRPNEQFEARLFALCRQPMSLKSWCRHSVYNAVRVMSKVTVGTFPIPAMLQNFLMFH